jgi:exodeoxyribonuclease III
MRCFSWNVNGIRAVQRKNLLPWDVIPSAEVIALQETKVQADQLDPDVREPDDWHAFWHGACKPGYSGTALLCRDQPDEVIEGMGDGDYDCEGRVISARFGTLVVISAYFPNSRDGGARLSYKLGFCAGMERFLANWRLKGCETLLLGDYNIAHQPIDLARPKENEKNAGYLPEERAWFGRYLQLGYRDIFRERYPDKASAYTWWAMRTNARARNVGWRIDYGTVSPGLADRVVDTTIHHDIHGSDHCPVGVIVS